MKTETTYNTLKEGDQVTHSKLGRGIVCCISHGEIHVQFGGLTKGIYDRNWFERYPYTLSQSICEINVKPDVMEMLNAKA